MTVGLIRTPQFANEIVEKVQADLIALGREMLMNPNWPAQASFELEAEVGFSFMPKTHDYYLTKRKAHLK